jgi:hypothetical protein
VEFYTGDAVTDVMNDFFAGPLISFSSFTGRTVCRGVAQEDVPRLPVERMQHLVHPRGRIWNENTIPSVCINLFGYNPSTFIQLMNVCLAHEMVGTRFRHFLPFELRFVDADGVGSVGTVVEGEICVGEHEFLFAHLLAEGRHWGGRSHDSRGAEEGGRGYLGESEGGGSDADQSSGAAVRC